MNSWKSILFGTFLGLIASAVIWLTSKPPQGVPIELRPPPTASPLVVHVAGAVVNPGVYELKRGSRVNDAIQAAGGVLEDGDTQAINLAKVVSDGERVWVPYKGEVGDDGSIMEEGRLLININTANQETLEKLPGIGPVTAGNIIKYRNEHGLFEKIEDIQNVPGIGYVTFQDLKDLITVGN